MTTTTNLEPAAFITERLDGTKRSVMLIEKYDPRKPEFWANEEARAQHRVIPLYAARSAPEAGKAVEPFGKDADNWADSVPDEYRPRCTEPGNEYAHPGSESAFSVGDLRRARTLSGASQ